MPPTGFTCPLRVSSWPWGEMKTRRSLGKQPNPPCQHRRGLLHTQSEYLCCRFPRCFLPACILMCLTLRITNPTDVSALARFRGSRFSRLSCLGCRRQAGVAPAQDCTNSACAAHLISGSTHCTKGFLPRDTGSCETLLLCRCSYTRYSRAQLRRHPGPPSPFPDAA